MKIRAGAKAVAEEVADVTIAAVVDVAGEAAVETAALAKVKIKNRIKARNKIKDPNRNGPGFHRDRESGRETEYFVSVSKLSFLF